MKITIYTIKDCAFSKQEKKYLNTNKLVFEEKDLETNKDFLTEMLAISNNFAGTPVTRVEKEDGSIAVLKGFTKEEFDKTFGFAAMPTAPGLGNPTPTATDSVVPSPVNDTPIPVTTPTETVIPAPIVETPVTPPAETPASPSVSNDPLKSVMDDLQSKSEPTTEVPPPPPVIDPAAPTIPDFPAK